MKRFSDKIGEATEVAEHPQQPNYNPLDEAVAEKPYSKPNIGATANEMTTPIDEPMFIPPPIDRNRHQTSTADQPKREPVNPEMKSLNKKDTEIAASQAAKMMLTGYEWLHTVANKSVCVSEKKLIKLQEEGEINLNAMIDYEYGKKIRAGDFFQEYNKQASQTFTVTDEFKEEITPVLERVLAKRGIGVTDEQNLFFLIGKDAATKVIIGIQMRTQTNSIIESIKQATASQYHAAPPPPPQRPQQSEAPPPPPPPQPEATHYREPEENRNVAKVDSISMPKKRTIRKKI